MENSTNFNSAWEGAKAGKIIRDIARESDITSEEKTILDNIAERREETAIQKYKEKNNADITNEKNAQALVREGLELIKCSDNLKFGILGVGNILNQKNADTLGVSGYIFDQKLQQMIRVNNLDFLDYTNNASDKNFEPEWRIYELPKDIECIAVRLPIYIRPEELHNSFITETRGAGHITLALEFSKTTLFTLGNKTIAEKISECDIEFIGQLFTSCCNEFISAYWNYISFLRERYKATL